jgi:hypothetical protein
VLLQEEPIFWFCALSGSFLFVIQFVLNFLGDSPDGRGGCQKITVWDSGNHTGDPAKGSSTANFISQFVKSLPALHDVAGMAGLELPQYLGKTFE